jgi:nucleoid DNA-binding protein
MKKFEVIEQIATEAGVPSSDVANVLRALQSIAVDQVRTGFLLPGFGELRLEHKPGQKGINPFTGEEVIFRGPPQLAIEPDSTLMDRICSGHSSEQSDDSKSVLVGRRKLPECKLYVESSNLAPNEKAICGKLGGEPTWIQSPKASRCCGNEMTFYAQIDSENLSDEFNLLDAGSAYLFFCDGCGEMRTIVQCY